MLVWRTVGLYSFATVIVLLKLGTVANAAEAFKVIAPSYACKTDENYSKLMKLIISEDDAAALKFVMSPNARRRMHDHGAGQSLS